MCMCCTLSNPYTAGMGHTHGGGGGGEGGGLVELTDQIKQKMWLYTWISWSHDQW